MANLKLKDESVLVGYVDRNQNENNLFRFDMTKTYAKQVGGKWTYDNPINEKKITSTVTPNLMGKGRYNTIGGSVLSFLKMTEDEPFNKYYGVRGEIAELLVLEHFRNNLEKAKMSGNLHKYELVRYTQSMFDNYDQFPLSKEFGGVIDLYLKTWKTDKPNKFIKAVIEVKGKSQDKETKDNRIETHPEYQSIYLDKGEANADELLQGRHLATMNHCSITYMAYVFFPLHIENQIKDYMKKYGENINGVTVIKGLNLSLNDVHIRVIPHKTNEEEMLKEMKKVRKLVDYVIEQQALPLKFFNEWELKYLFGVLEKRNSEQR